MSTKRSLRFRFSLRTLLVFSFLLSAVGGVWVGMVEPIRNQWRAAEPILELGGRIETKPSNVPAWLKALLPEGKTEDIEAVFFNYQTATDEAILALEKLPQLQRLYVERSNLQPQHIDSIAKLNQLRRLSIWGNRSLKKADLEKLARLENLDVIDMHDCSNADWKTLLAFRSHSKTKIINSFYPRQVIGEDIDQLVSVKHLLRHPGPFGSLNSNNADDLEKLRSCFPESEFVFVSIYGKVDDSYFAKSFQLCQADPFRMIVYPGAKNQISGEFLRERACHTIRQAWEQLGPRCSQVIIETDSGHPDSNKLGFRCANTSGTTGTITVHLGNEYEIPQEFFKSLPLMPEIQSFSFRCYDDKLVNGTEHVLARLPNLTEVELNNVSSWHDSLWQGLAKLPQIEKLTINSRGRLSNAMPENYPNGFEFRETLKHLSVKASYPTTEELKKLKSAFPNLQSFNGKEIKKLESE